MTVVTDRRRYAFELRSGVRGGVTAPDMAYMWCASSIRQIPLPPAVAVVTPPAPPEQRNIRYTYTGSRASLAVFGIRRRAFHLLPMAGKRVGAGTCS